jgi:hypothetical protein
MIQKGGEIGRRLALSVKRGTDRFDPAKFYYITSLARRCVGKRASVVRRIEQKALSALEDYNLRYEKERKNTLEIVEDISSEYPDAADRVRGLFENCDFKGVRRLSKRLHRRNNQYVLAGLTQQVGQCGRLADVDEAQLSFDERLRHQEKDAVQSIGRCPVDERPDSNVHQGAPKSFHLFKETWAKQYADALVTHAIKNRPEDPGPLNGQMLATRSLAAMRNLSPSYLNRFVAYIETLLWLQQADKNGGSRNSKRQWGGTATTYNRWI